MNHVYDSQSYERGNNPESLYSEWLRLRTFVSYPRSSPYSSILLAKQGFFYNDTDKSNDTVTCVFCSFVWKNLDTNDNVKQKHQKSGCPILQGLNCGNISISCLEPESHKNALSLLSRQNGKCSDNLNSESENAPEKSINQEFEISREDVVSAYGAASSVITNTIPVITSSPFSLTVSSEVADSNATTACVTNHSLSLSFQLSKSYVSPNSGDNFNTGVWQEQALTDAGTEATTTLNEVSTNYSSTSHDPPHVDTDSSHNPQRNSNEPITDTSHPSSSSAPQANTNNQQERFQPSNSQVLENNSQRPSENSQPVPSDSTPPSSYEHLGIMTARPKRPQYAVETTRLQSFNGWPSNHHISVEALAKAGYFYTGYSDCARCYFCGGGLRNWEKDDDVWVEHARWFPKCGFIRQILGQRFIDVVQDLSKEKEIIPYSAVIDEMKARGLEKNLPKDKTSVLENTAAIQTVIHYGFNKEDSVKAAANLKEAGTALSAELVYEELLRMKAERSNVPLISINGSKNVGHKKMKSDKGTIESLRNANIELRQQMSCKICMDNEVSVVFLPCGHFVSCHDCSFALNDCPVCRENIKGQVRVSLQ